MIHEFMINSKLRIRRSSRKSSTVFFKIIHPAHVHVDKIPVNLHSTSYSRAPAKNNVVGDRSEAREASFLLMRQRTNQARRLYAASNV